MFGMGVKAKPHDNDLRNDIVDDAASTMEFNDCDDIVQDLEGSSLENEVLNVLYYLATDTFTTGRK